ncbi:uncharacterized protein LOC133558853 [Nerophis ophidion]|uniref:uncharacterized protein LOC133558853 n=1 Tax=Nerophis ophidion TaxID=159077 RepID=UPI002ADF5930|nr:uncharacterized protein LOC133558853 [Nerophis ophidion]XP_061765962.1 uncharacterized protein LOC133558853 [Nerophis ophidion]
MCQQNPAIMKPNERRQAQSPADGLARSGPGHGRIQPAQCTPVSMEKGRTHGVIDGSIIPESPPPSTYRTYIRREIPPRCISCVVFLDRLFSLSLVAPQGRGRDEQHRSTLFVRLCASSTRPSSFNQARQTTWKAKTDVMDITQRGDVPSKLSGPRVPQATWAGAVNREAATVKSLAFRRPSPVYNHGLNADEAFFNPDPATGGQDRTEEPRECPTSLKPNPAAEDGLQSLSLKEALELFRPDFISRSRGRVRRMERRAKRRRKALQGSKKDLVQGLQAGRRNCTTPDPLCDNLFKPRERSISGREMQRRSRRKYNMLPEVEEKRREEEKRALSRANRLRAGVFTKTILEQILQK